MFDIGLIKRFSPDAKDKILITLLLDEYNDAKSRNPHNDILEPLKEVIHYYLTKEEIEELGL